MLSTNNFILFLFLSSILLFECNQSAALLSTNSPAERTSEIAKHLKSIYSNFLESTASAKDDESSDNKESEFDRKPAASFDRELMTKMINKLRAYVNKIDETLKIVENSTTIPQNGTTKETTNIEQKSSSIENLLYKACLDKCQIEQNSTRYQQDLNEDELPHKLTIENCKLNCLKYEHHSGGHGIATNSNDTTADFNKQSLTKHLLNHFKDIFLKNEDIRTEQVHQGSENDEDVDKWSKWSNWSECSASCGQPGKQLRFRKCRNNKCEANYEIHEKPCMGKAC